jgi:hypothetical protein
VSDGAVLLVAAQTAVGFALITGVFGALITRSVSAWSKHREADGEESKSVGDKPGQTA